MKIPLCYPILDADSLRGSAEEGRLLQATCSHALALAEAGCTLMQYRAKQINVREALAQARELRRLLPGITLIMNDRADLGLAAGFDGVHIAQDDLSPEGARRVVGAERIVGLSAHNSTQIIEALTKPIDYLMIGPVFERGSKPNSEPLVRMAGVTEARRLRDESGRMLPLVAIGGITPVNAEAVLKAGADSVAVSSGVFFSSNESVKKFFQLGK
ncbi:MAG: thiamine phosphate synthase [Acidobacteria bacterium]|nr:MAG: thiamine phosphate synthase [Acidobacteriota bacterium]